MSSHSQVIAVGSANPFHRLADWLRRARDKHLTTRFRGDLMWTLCATLWCFSSSSLFTWAISGRANPYTTATVLAASAAVALAGTTLSVVRFLTARPPLDWYARRIDRSMGLAETISTAFEIAGSTAAVSRMSEGGEPARGLAEATTLSDALRESTRIDLGEFQARHQHLGLAFSFGLAVLSLALLPTVVELPEAPPHVAVEDFTAAVAEVAAVLNDLASDADEAEYVTAISNELKTLVAELAGLEFVPSEARSRVGELLQHATSAIRGDPRATAMLSEAVAEAGSVLTSERTPLLTRPNDSHESALAAADPRRLLADQPPVEGAAGPLPRPGMEAPGREGEGGSELTQANEVLSFDRTRTEYNQVIPELKALKEALERLQAQYAMPVGEAQGQRPGVFGNDEIGVDGELSGGPGGEDFVLPEHADASRTVRVDAPVDANLVASDVSVIDGSTWRRMTESTILPERTPQQYRALVSRYFQRAPEDAPR